MPSATDLYEALKKKNIDKCLKLLKSGININDIVQARRKWTCLTEACVLGDKEIVEKILYKGADCNHKTTGGITPLMIAAGNGHTDVVDTLISEGKNCDINDKDNDGNTALHYAVRHGYTETVDMLLQKCAAVNEQTEEGKTPLFLALRKQHVVCVDLLLLNGADVNLKTYHDEETPLHAAAMALEPRGLSLILERCTDVNVTDAEQNTALHLLLKANGEEDSEELVLECCKLLLRHKINCSQRNKFHKLAVDYVSSKKMSCVAKLLQTPVTESVGHAPGMSAEKLRDPVKELEEGQRIHSDRIEEVSGDVRTIKKKVQNVHNAVKGLKGQASDYGEQIAQLQNLATKSIENMENLKDDLARSGVRPRTGNIRTRGRPNPEDEEGLGLRIRDMLVELRRHIQPEVEDHAEFLYQERAITRSEYDDIKNQRTPRDKASTLVSCIETNLTKEKFNSFAQSLKKHENTKRLAAELMTPPKAKPT